MLTGNDEYLANQRGCKFKLQISVAYSVLKCIISTVINEKSAQSENEAVDVKANILEMRLSRIDRTDLAEIREYLISTRDGTLVTHPMLQLRLNRTELRAVDYYSQIFCRC